MDSMIYCRTRKAGNATPRSPARGPISTEEDGRIVLGRRRTNPPSGLLAQWLLSVPDQLSCSHFYDRWHSWQKSLSRVKEEDGSGGGRGVCWLFFTSQGLIDHDQSGLLSVAAAVSEAEVEEAAGWPMALTRTETPRPRAHQVIRSSS